MPDARITFCLASSSLSKIAFSLELAQRSDVVGTAQGRIKQPGALRPDTAPGSLQSSLCLCSPTQALQGDSFPLCIATASLKQLQSAALPFIPVPPRGKPLVALCREQAPTSAPCELEVPSCFVHRDAVIHGMVSLPWLLLTLRRAFLISLCILIPWYFQKRTY